MKLEANKALRTTLVTEREIIESFIDSIKQIVSLTLIWWCEGEQPGYVGIRDSRSVAVFFVKPIVAPMEPGMARHTMRHMRTPSLKLSNRSAPPGSSGIRWVRNGSPTK